MIRKNRTLTVGMLVVALATTAPSAAMQKTVKRIDTLLGGRSDLALIFAGSVAVIALGNWYKGRLETQWRNGELPAIQPPQEPAAVRPTMPVGGSLVQPAGGFLGLFAQNVSQSDEQTPVASAPAQRTQVQQSAEVRRIYAQQAASARAILEKAAMSAGVSVDDFRKAHGAQTAASIPAAEASEAGAGAQSPATPAGPGVPLSDEQLAAKRAAHFASKGQQNSAAISGAGTSDAGAAAGAGA